jgi:hypothetical protein
VQVDIGANSYLVGPGDHFFVPENCNYQLTNHSADTDAEISFVVIKPAKIPVEAPARRNVATKSGSKRS